MIDFGGDADGDKCQVRIDKKECPEKSRFLFHQNSETIRSVCNFCLPLSIDFAYRQTKRPIVIYVKDLV